VCHAHFGDSVEALEAGLHREFSEAAIERSLAESAPALDAWIQALGVHIDEGGPRPDLPVHVFGTALQIRIWRFLTALGAAFGFLPLVNALTTERHLGHSLLAGDWVFAGLDLTMLAIGLIFAVAACGLRRWAPAEPPASLRSLPRAIDTGAGHVS